MTLLQLFRYRVPLALAVICGLAILVYWPGLHGPFLFDDLANIKALGDFNGVRDRETFLLFVFGNQSGPTGRPIAMLSFLIDGRDWPTDPFPFKRTNLVLHIVNGLLLFSIVRLACTRIQNFRTHSSFIALVATSFWLLHPFNISTVLYPVQRMAILSTLFVLAGLLAYLHGRFLLAVKPRKAYLWMSTGIVAGTILATFSKENGALLVLFVICLELTVLAYGHQEPGRLWKALFLWLPVAVLAGYFLHGLFSGGFEGGYARRSFTMQERILTQPRILFDYLYYWYVPQVGSPGLLTEDYPLSRSLFTPITTLFAMIGLLASLVLSIAIRQRFPLVSLAILFYLSGHLIESTVIPLEMYFEHRNYLPGVFLGLPVAVAIHYLVERHKGWLILPLLLIAILAILAYQRADIWSSEESLADHWASIHPESTRALRYAALVAENHGKPLKAIHYLDQARSALPDNIAVELHWLTQVCRLRPISKAEMEQTRHKLEHGYFSFTNYELIRSTLEFTATPACKGLDKSDTISFIRALGQNREAIRSAGARYQLGMIEGRLALQSGDHARAATIFRQALQQYPNADGALLQVGMLASAGQFRLALEHVEYIEKNITLKRKTGRLDYRRELEILKETLLRDLEDEVENK